VCRGHVALILLLVTTGVQIKGRGEVCWFKGTSVLAGKTPPSHLYYNTVQDKVIRNIFVQYSTLQTAYYN
jgi:hypothetical protein